MPRAIAGAHFVVNRLFHSLSKGSKLGEGIRAIHAPFLRIFLAALLTLTGVSADASHFRFGHMSWQRAAGQTNPLTIDITVIEAWRADGFGAGDIIYTIDHDGTTFSTLSAPLTGTLQDFTGETYSIFTQTLRHTFPSNGVYTVSSSSTFRLIDLVNAPATPVSLGMTIDLRPSNTGTPLTTGPVILQLPVDSTNSVAIPIVDPDNDPLNVRFATTAESGITGVPTVGGNRLSISPDGVLNWNTSGGVVGQRFAVQLAIEENHPGFTSPGRVPLEFILELVNLTTNQRPTCVGPTGQLSGQVGTPISLSIKGTDPEGGNLRFTGEQLPPGAVLTPPSGSTNASPSNINLTWVPGANNFGQTFPVTLVFTDDHGLQGSCSFSIKVDTQIPLPSYGQITGTPGGTAAGASVNPVISREARFVAFTSDAPGLVTNDDNGITDVFVKDRATGETKLLSVNTAGTAGNGISRDPVVSADGRYVAFQSAATDLVPNDNNGRVDLFVYDTSVNRMHLASATPVGVSGSGDSFAPAFSLDGGKLVFVSTADNLTSNDTNGTSDVFVRDLTTGTTTLISVNTNGVAGAGSSATPVISENGRFVAFSSSAPDLVTNDGNGLNDVFVRDLTSGFTSLASANTNGVGGNRISFGPAISPGGDRVAFVSQATDLINVVDTNGQTDVYLREIGSGSNVLVSVTAAGTTGSAGSASPVFSTDGQNVLFISIATNFAAIDNNGRQDVFLWNRATRATELISVRAGGGGTANGLSGITAASISRDNRYVTFFSEASDLIAGNADTNGVADVFLRDRQSGVTRLVSYNPGTGQIADGRSFSPFISGDGQTVVFATDAANLLTNDQNNATDIIAANVTNAAPSSLVLAVFVNAPDEIPAGVDFPVTVQIHNYGSEAVDELVLANLASTGVSRVSASATLGEVDAVSGNWKIGTLPSLASATLSMRVTAALEGPANIGAEVIPSDPRLSAGTLGRASTSVSVSSPPEIDFQDYASYSGDEDNPWPAELANGLTRRFAPDGSVPAGINVSTHGFGRVLRFTRDVLGALPERVGIVWSGAGAGLSAEVYDAHGRRIGHQVAPRGDVDQTGHRFFALEHKPGIAVLVIQTDGVLDEIQVTTHSGLPFPAKLVFAANGDETVDTTSGLIGAGYNCATSATGFRFPEAIPPVNGPVSIEFWMRPNADLHSGSAVIPLVSMPGGGLDVWYSAGFLHARAAAAVGPAHSVAHRADVSAGTWHHVAVTIEANVIRLYFDGRPVALESFPATFSTGGSDLVLGSSADPILRSFAGSIDEFACFGSALSPATVADLFRQSRLGKVRPQVSVNYRRDVVELTWPTFFDGYVVQAATRVGPDADWTAHEHYKHIHGGAFEVSLPASAGYRYFRLIQPPNAPLPNNNPNN